MSTARVPKRTISKYPSSRLLFIASRMTLLVGVLVNCPCPSFGASQASEITRLSKEIRDVVRQLDYSEKTANDVVKMILAWKHQDGGPLLLSWIQTLSDLREHHQQGKVSAAQLASTEASVARKIGDKMRKDFKYEEDAWSLADVIAKGKAQCFSYSQLYYIVGSLVGLTSKVIDVRELREGQIPKGKGHMACMVSLTDGKVMMVDLAFGFVSEPFVLESQFAKVGDLLEIKDKENRLKIHKKFRVLDKQTLRSALYWTRATRGQDSESTNVAMSHLTKAIELDPKNPLACYNRANIFLELGQFEKAIADYSKTIELDPKYAPGYENRGIAYGRLGQYSKGLLNLNKAIELNPMDPTAYMNRGIIRADLKEYPQAFSDYRIAIAIDPNISDVYYNRGNAYGALGKHKEAITDYTKAIELDPANAPAYVNRGATYIDVGMYGPAVNDFTRVIEFDPNSASAYFNRGTANLHRGEYDRAISDFTAALERDPKYDAAHASRGMAYLVTRQYPSALADLTKAIEINPEYAMAYFNRGQTYAVTGKTDKARKDLLRAAQLDSSFRPLVKRLSERFDLGINLKDISTRSDN